MTRILLVETASPKRVRQTAEALLSGAVYPEAELTILCTADPTTREYFRALPGVQVLPFEAGGIRGQLAKLRSKNFDVMRVFWTGEKKYRRMKLLAFRIGIPSTDVDSGDGSVFRLTWKALLRFWIFRWRHPLPTDHYDYVSQPGTPEPYYQGERILIVQSADPPYLLRALDRLKEIRLFRDPRYTLFCRNEKEVLARFTDNPMIFELRTHTETRGFWRHLRELRQERFDASVVFFSGDPSYWKMKYFVFFLGARHKVIFNENNDCFFFSWGAWFPMLLHRLGERSRFGGPNWYYQFPALLFLAVKALLFPFRFAWLLLVWLRLRSSG